MYLCVFCQILEKLNPYFLKLFLNSSSPSLWDVDNIISDVLSLSHRSPPLCSFLLSWLAPVCFSDWIIGLVLCPSSPVHSCHQSHPVRFLFLLFYFQFSNFHSVLFHVFCFFEKVVSCLFLLRTVTIDHFFFFFL